MMPPRIELRRYKGGRSEGPEYTTVVLPSSYLRYTPSRICPICHNGPLAMLAWSSPTCRQQSSPMTHWLHSFGNSSYSYTYMTSLEQMKGPHDCSWCRQLPSLLSSDVAHLERSGKDSTQGVSITPTSPVEVVITTDTIWREVKYVHVKLDSPNAPRGSRVRHRSSILVYTHTGDPAAAYFTYRPRITDRGSATALSCAKAYIDNCVKHHRRCRKPARATGHSSRLPSRLVDCSNPDRPRLVLGSAVEAKSPYLALSYVWGGCQPHSATTTNLAAYCAAIDPGLDLLPQTIRDAIRVTHDLGQRYLWIDSLCILQDSEADKHRELARMVDVYRNAYLTIVAGSAKRATEGFLHDPAPPVSVPYILPFNFPGSSWGIRRRQKTGALCLTKNRLDLDIRATADPLEWEDPINERAWCLQESMMSRRTLFFETGSFCFRCPSSHERVSGCGEVLEDHHAVQLDNAFLQRPDRRRVARLYPAFLRDLRIWLRPTKPMDDAASFRDQWWRVVYDYSQRGVSNPSDKLVACAAIAEVFHSRWGGSDYLAGLWRSTLLWDLLWSMSSKASKALTTPQTNRAPSWSWAGVDETVISRGQFGDYPSMDKYTDIPIAELVACDVTLDDPALPFGGVSRGALTLRAPLIRCAWGEAQSESSSTADEGSVGRQCVYLGNAQQAERRATTAATLETLEEIPTSWDTSHVGWGHLDRMADFGVEDLWAAFIVRPHPQDSGSSFRGLVVVSSDADDGGSGNPTVYRRVGYFNIELDDLLGLGWDVQSLPTAVEFTIV
ncbi:heterokaryon incompatibility protein-domain-containing protein [Trametes polyzona]|nr:heterokaryon incompatibility protein-domain-containing protein [Trametes polyzona]